MKYLAAVICLYSAIALADNGGNIGYNAANLYNPQPITGFCASACTARLRSAVCIDRNSTYLFHHATTSLGTRILANAYTPSLRRLYLSHCQLSACNLTAHDLSGFGYRICD